MHVEELAAGLHPADGDRVDAVSGGQPARDVLQGRVRQRRAHHDVGAHRVPRAVRLAGACGAGQRTAQRDERRDHDESDERQHGPRGTGSRHGEQRARLAGPARDPQRTAQQHGDGAPQQQRASGRDEHGRGREHQVGRAGDRHGAASTQRDQGPAASTSSAASIDTRRTVRTRCARRRRCRSVGTRRASLRAAVTIANAGGATTPTTTTTTQGHDSAPGAATWPSARPTAAPTPTTTAASAPAPAAMPGREAPRARTVRSAAARRRARRSAADQEHQHGAPASPASTTVACDHVAATRARACVSTRSSRDVTLAPGPGTSASSGDASSAAICVARAPDPA